MNSTTSGIRGSLSDSVGTTHRRLGGDNFLAQRAWNFLNDSLRLDLCVRFRAEVLASAAIYYAALEIGAALPLGPDHPPWRVLFGATEEEIRDVCMLVMCLYRRPRVEWADSLKPDAAAREREDARAETGSASDRFVRAERAPAAAAAAASSAAALGGGSEPASSGVGGAAVALAQARAAALRIQQQQQQAAEAEPPPAGKKAKRSRWH